MPHNAAMLLIFPPMAKPCEPPAGVARLSSALRAHEVACRVLDANLEAMLWLLEQPLESDDTWTRRAAKNRNRNLATLRCKDTYQVPDRYRRAVSDLNRLVSEFGKQHGIVLGLSDYQHPRLSPLRSADLLHAAGHPGQNPFYPWFSHRLPELLDGSQTVGFSLNYLNQALTTFAMVGFLKQQFPFLQIVLGGGLISSWLQRPESLTPFAGLVDHFVAGPGEKHLLALSGIESAASDLFLPDYDQLSSYLSPGFILPYSASSGCYWNSCTFCPEQAEGIPYATLPTVKVLDELRQLTARHNPALIHILDNAISPALLNGLANSPPGAPWYGFARFGKELCDPGFCHALRRSGCVMLKLGLESGDQQVLDRLHKGIDLANASQVLRNLHAAGIATYIYLLFGTPAETEEAARRTLEFVERHQQEITFLNLAIFNMPAYATEAEELGTVPFYEGDLSLYTAFRHPARWDRQQVRRFLEKEFKRSPAIAQILRNDPPLFTSNHAPFFCNRDLKP